MQQRLRARLGVSIRDPKSFIFRRQRPRRTSIVTDDRDTFSDKVLNLSGVIQIKRKFI